MARYNRYQRTAKYSDEFKVSAVLLSNLDECTVKSVAESLDIHPVQLSIWRRQYREGLLVSDKRKKIIKKSSSLKESQKVEALQAEIERLKIENDILKKWQRFLAEQRKKNFDL
jgi:transposase